MDLLDTFLNDFKSINSDIALVKFVAKYELANQDTAGGNLLGKYSGQVEGKNIAITHSWYDPSGPFNMQPDMNKLILTVDGKQDVTVRFSD